MNEFWHSSYKQKIKIWRQLRKSLVDLPLEEKLDAVVNFWKMAPVSSNVTDIYDEKTWPGPWEYISGNIYDDNNVALGMAYTLHVEHQANCNILLVQNTKESFLKLIVSVNDMYMLNYTYGCVEKLSELPEDTIVLKNIPVDQLS